MLELRFLGEFAVFVDGERVTNFYSDKVRALLAYLVMARGQAHSRAKLAGLLWPEYDDRKARQSLRQALMHLRKGIRDKQRGTPLLVADRNTVQLNWGESVIFDVAAFEAALDERGGAQKAADLYTGAFLDGFFVDSAEYEDWLLLQRETLRNDALAAFNLTVNQAAQQSDHAQTVKYALRWLSLEPYQEEAHRALMRAYFAQGDQKAALKQYATCEETLHAELAITPTEETQALYNEIRLSGESGRSNLPVPVTPFIGRSNELITLQTYLDNPACRLITLVGVGGSGKTRLAIAVASQFEETLFVGLDALTDANGVPLVVADVLGLELSDRQDPAIQVAEYLSKRKLLLLIDNVEQLLDGENGDVLRQLFTDWLRAAPAVRLLVTSRQRLKLQAEWLYEVEGLREAVDLFCERGRQVQREFALTTENRPIITQICDLCADLPLAIELAASWLYLLDLAEIRAELQAGLDLLETSSPDVPVRQRSLRVVFLQSWRRLDSAEKTALQHLAIFHNGFTRTAAKTVAAAPFPALVRLIDKSLLQRIVTTGKGRFALQKPLRLFLNEMGVPPELAARHQAYYLQLIADEQHALESDGQQAALNAIGREIDNVRAAWRRAVAEKDSAALDNAVESLYYFYDTQSWLREGVAMLGTASEALAARRHEAAIGRIWARVTARQAWLQFQLGERKLARQRLEACLAILHAQGHRHELQYPFCFLAAACHEMGETRTAQSAARSALQISAERNDAFYAGIAHNILGQIATAADDLPTAQRHHEHSIEMATQTGNQLTMAFALTFLGKIALQQEAIEDARSLLLQSLAIREQLGFRRGIAANYFLLGQVETLAQETVAAQQFFAKSLHLYHAIGDVRAVNDTTMHKLMTT